MVRFKTLSRDEAKRIISAFDNYDDVEFDDLVNHFNKEIVVKLIPFLMVIILYKNGSTLLFTTHYPELLDEYDRNDAIYIVRNRNGITAENLSYILKRNDIKKSDAYQSGFLEGTTPAYEAYLRLKKNLAASLK